MERNEDTHRVAAHASSGMRDLAHSTIVIDDPADLYPLIGEILSAVRSLTQITDQLARAHMHYRGRARTDDGDATLGARTSDSAAWALTRARELLDAAEGAIDQASQNAGQVMWMPARSTERWVSVVFLQGAAADQMLGLIDQHGAVSAISHLVQWDRGDETTEAALINGYVYEGIPTCPTDVVAEDHEMGYALKYNGTLGYVSLLRRDQRDAVEHRPVESVQTPVASSTSWFVPAWFASPRPGLKDHVRSVSL
ncbi:hypothetical protein [uncultured Microbacterium sp.]|uniref:hypothetical protein n=1 Tax=uncultured Microbacterium sp. TaxID=191216 RepID=UPI0028D71486|nr:hypothetical protein [uncultured Microbacterium sp.]